MFRAVAIVLTVSVLAACAAEPQQETTVRSNEECLFSNEPDLTGVVSHMMSALDAKRHSAIACSTELAPPSQSSPATGIDQPSAGGAAPTKADYDAVVASYMKWLTFVAGETAFLGVSNPDSKWTADYKALATAAQDIDGFLQACGAPPRSECGDMDTGCQLGEARKNNFQLVGEDIIIKFRGCPTAVRENARDALISNHSWK